MRTWIAVGIVFAVGTFAFGQKAETVEELTQTVLSLQQSGKNDAEVATALEKIQLGQELTAADALKLQQHLPGPSSLDQLAVMRGLSAFAPSQAPASAPPTPDASAQSAILARAGAWIGSAFSQTPTFTASRAEFHYQEDLQGTNSAAAPQEDQSGTYHRSLDERTDSVQISQGVEREVSPESKVNWGENGQISDGESIPSLPNLFQEASASGKLTFTNWGTVNGKTAAVFSFAVTKKKSRYTLDYCCFPIAETVVADQTPSGDAMITPGASTRVTRWRPFKKAAPYHGFLYIDPESGAILRTVTIAELKPFDFIRMEEECIDYAPGTIDGKAGVVLSRRVRLTEAVPGGDTRPASYPVRRTLLVAEYVLSGSK